MKKLWIALILSLCCTITVSAMPKTLIPGGCTVGIKLQSSGLVVTGFEKGSPARAAGIKKGDVITKVNGEAVHTASALRDTLDADRVVVTVLRQGREVACSVEPQDSKLGAFIRTSMAGIGTVTFYDPNTGKFGALGHGVTDLDAEILLPLESGVVVHSSVTDVEKGTSGQPGELKGNFDIHRILGSVASNTENGIFGTMTTPIPGTPMEIADPSEVQPGQATILSNITGTEVQPYSVEIVKIYPNANKTTRNLLLKITDPTLLQTTGGIVQGMSGSPIIQDGKLIGAVTHVLVNDPTRGYGIFIENMLDTAE